MADPALTISSESVCFIVGKACALDGDDIAARELRTFVAALNEEQQVDLVALMWLGRGDGTLDDWHDLRDEARQQRDERTLGCLLGEPLLAEHLEEGLSQFGFAGAEFEIDRLRSLPPVFV